MNFTSDEIEFINPSDVTKSAAWNSLDTMTSYRVALAAAKEHNLTGIMTREALENFSVWCYAGYIEHLRESGESVLSVLSSLSDLHSVCSIPGHQERAICISLSGDLPVRTGITVYRVMEIPGHTLYTGNNGEVMSDITDPLFVKNADGVYTGCNDAFVLKSGYSREQVIGKTIFDMMPADMADDLVQSDHHIFTSLGERVEIQKIVLENKSGQVTGMVGIMSQVEVARKIRNNLAHNVKTK